ncbi:MAG: mechanosensitive ion channel family protein [Bacteroidetes bacterium]|nr:MAG: mechanosensitive ion channel family protein [Bacteroidota bacterium]TAG94190.1 MAG: mechanosensitive ion channel family protein [Bacteroidota bacterium]
MLVFFKFNLNNPYIEYPLIIISAFLSAYILSTITRSTFAKLLDIASESLKIDVTKFNFIKNAITFTIYVCFTIWVCAMIPSLRHIGDTLFAGAGILAAIVGFASQQAFSNIISGIFIVIFKPFRVGDNIKIGLDVSGTVEDITLRHVIIKNPENRRVIIPNSLISSQTIINSSIVDERVCGQIEFTLDHNTNIDVAIQIITEEIKKHPDFLDGRTEDDIQENVPEIRVLVVEINPVGVQVRGYAWAKDGGKSFFMKTDLFKSIKDRFDATGIHFAQMPKISFGK